MSPFLGSIVIEVGCPSGSTQPDRSSARGTFRIGGSEARVRVGRSGANAGGGGRSPRMFTTSSLYGRRVETMMRSAKDLRVWARPALFLVMSALLAGCGSARPGPEEDGATLPPIFRNRRRAWQSTREMRSRSSSTRIKIRPRGCRPPAGKHIRLRFEGTSRRALHC